MSYKNNIIGQNSEINHELFYSMARNDDLIKTYYEGSSYGILGWYESETSITVPVYDPEAVEENIDSPEDSGDPEWFKIASIVATPGNERVIKFSIRGLSVMHESTSQISEVYKHALNARFSIQYPQDQDEDETPSTKSFIPYRFVASGNFVSADNAREFGRIFGENICISTLEVDSPDVNIYRNYPLIRPSKSLINLEVKKLNVPQKLIINGESKFQVIIEDIGEWR